MSEPWKSGTNYWCKHCRTYVRDTPLERNNHEATLTHQNAVKRSLRELHRGYEREEREKERAKAEIERLNRLVPGSSSTSSATGSAAAGKGAGAGRTAAQGAVEAERKRQMEQLAGLGVAIPTEFKGDLAMPGEWTVTSTRVVMDDGGEGGVNEGDVEGRARGVRKREVTEEQREEEEAVRGFFKKPRKWGRATKGMPLEGDKEIDALLSGEFGAEARGSVGGVKKEAEVVKKEEGAVKEESGVKKEEDGIKKEEDAEDHGVKGEGKPAIKPEPEDEGSGIAADAPLKAAGEAGPTPVFKKRKAKNIRQK